MTNYWKSIRNKRFVDDYWHAVKWEAQHPTPQAEVASKSAFRVLLEHLICWGPIVVRGILYVGNKPDYVTIDKQATPEMLAEARKRWKADQEN